MFMVKLFSLQQSILHLYCITSVDHIDSIRHIMTSFSRSWHCQTSFFRPLLFLTHPPVDIMDIMGVIVRCFGIMSCVLDACSFLTDIKVIYHSSFTLLDSGYRQIILSIRSTLYPGTQKSVIEY